MPAKLDISGQRYGRLVAISPTGERRGGKIVWTCICDCGSTSLAVINHLRNGQRVSCGCAKTAGNQIKKKSAKHGHYVGNVPTATYRIWSGMKSRCLNKNVPEYKNYGGRGIKVCERWMDFSNFLEDMGARPDGLSIDRVNNDGHYEPDNCRWATEIEQHNNRSDNTLLTYNGETLTISEWSRKLGINKHTLADRIRKSEWATEKVITSKIMTKSEIAKQTNKKRWG